MCLRCAFTQSVLAWNDSLVSIDWCRWSLWSRYISLQCPLSEEKICFLFFLMICCFSHQEEVSLHGRSVPGCQLQDVPLFYELVRGVNDVLLLTQHLVDFQQFLQILLNEDGTFILVRCQRAGGIVKFKENKPSTHRFSNGAVGVSRRCANDF